MDLAWVLDPRSSTLHDYPRGGRVVVLHDADIVSAHPFLADFECRVAEFFAS